MGVSFALNISADGDLLDVLPLFDQVQRGKKTVEVPRRMTVPAQAKRSVNIAPNFLWDNAVYVLGLSDKDAAYWRIRFDSFRAHNIELLQGADSVVALAVLGFLERYDPEADQRHPAIEHYRDTLRKVAISSFCLRANSCMTILLFAGPGKITLKGRMRSACNV